MHDIVIINIVNLHPIFIKRRTANLIARGVDCHIAMIPLVVVCHNSVTLHHLSESNNLRFLRFKDMCILRIVALLQLYEVRIGLAERLPSFLYYALLICITQKVQRHNIIIR